MVGPTPRHSRAPRANGYLHTVTSIPGYNGAFPGTNSSRVLAIEALPGTLDGQTDFYLQLGLESTPNYIPGNVWFQFWMYPQNYGAQMSRHGTRNKFLYMSNDTYPSHSHKWMISETSLTYNPHNTFPNGDPSSTFWWNLSSASGVSTIAYSGPGADPYASDQLGMQDLSRAMVPNRWTLVKMHIDTSTTAGRWRVWLRPQGGAWAQVANWQHGVNGLTWTIPSNQVGGHRMLRMPTTVGSPTNQWYDYWMYMDDFTMATSEADLPVYPDQGSTTAPQPQPPSDVRVIRSALLDGTLFLSPASVWKQLRGAE